MDAPLMPRTGEFKFCKRYFLSLMSLEVAAFSHLNIVRCSAESNSSTLRPRDVVHCVKNHKAASHALARVSACRPDCGTIAWELMCETLDAQSISRALSQLNKIIVMQATAQSLSAYVHKARQYFDELNDCLMLKDGFAALRPKSSP
jgi:hypothetical protein